MAGLSCCQYQVGEEERCRLKREESLKLLLFLLGPM